MALWTPAEITTTLWLDAADADALTLDGSAVSEWSDKSGGERHFTGAGTSAPAVVSSSLNDLDVIRFDGSNDILEGNSAAKGITRNLSAFTIFAVGRNTGGDTLRSVFVAMIGGTLSARVALYFKSGAVEAGGRRLDADGYQQVAVTQSGASLISGVFDYANASLQVGLNGVYTSRSGGFQSAGATSDTDSLVVRLGGGSTTAWSLQGDIAEIVAFQSIPADADRYKVEGYLAHKWGLASSLASDHPYKDDAPTLGLESSILTIGPLGSGSITGGIPVDARVFAQGPLAIGALSSITSVGSFASASGPLADTSVLALLNLDAEANILATGPLASSQITADTDTPEGRIGATGPLASTDILAHAPQAGEWTAVGPLGSGSFLARTYPPLASIIPPGVTRYFCKLTGSPDLILPIESFSVRHRVETKSYYQIVVPNYDDYIDGISARRLGQIVIWSDTNGVTEELSRGTCGDVRTDRGPNSKSITISGNASRAATTPATYILAEALYAYSTFDGEQRLRIKPRAAIRPGDTIRYRDIFFTVGSVSWSVSDSGASMEVATEAPE